MVGYEYVTKQATVAGYIGGEVSHTGITPNDPNNTVKGTYAGLKVGADLYIRPTGDDDRGRSRLLHSQQRLLRAPKFGLAVVNQIYVGPEILVLGDNFFHQWRVGAHVSGIKLGMVQLGVSGGFLSDQVRGTGGYGILETRFSF